MDQGLPGIYTPQFIFAVLDGKNFLYFYECINVSDVMWYISSCNKFLM